MSRPPQQRNRPYDASEPAHIDAVLTELFQVRGYNRFNSNEQLQAIWDELAAEFSSEKMKVIKIKNGVLEIGISNSTLLYQLNSYYKREFLHTLQTQYKHLKVKDIKFRHRAKIT